MKQPYLNLVLAQFQAAACWWTQGRCYMEAYGGFTKKEIVTPKNNTSKVNGHAPKKISCSKGDGLSVRCIRSTVGYLFWELNVHGHFTKSSSLRKSPLNENFPVLRTVYFAGRTENRLLTMKNIVSRQFQFFLNNREQFVEYGVSVCRNYK